MLRRNGRERQIDEETGPDLGFKTSTDGQDLDFQNLDGQTHKQTTQLIKKMLKLSINAQGSKIIILIVQVEVLKIYVATMEAFGKN